jgi:hypothetical protein
MTELILTMHYPKSGITQAQEYLSLQEAIVTAHTHQAAFPDGYAQISEKGTGTVMMSNEDLRAGLDSARRPSEAAEMVPAASLIGWLFGRRRDSDEHQPD